jgi:hypothetical protein
VGWIARGDSSQDPSSLRCRQEEAVSLDFPAFGTALWSLSDETGIRPEYALPIFYSESGFNPAATNSINCQGISQICSYAHTLPAGYTSWTASQQMTIIAPMFAAIVAKYGSIRSGTRLYLANFLPAALPTCFALSSVLASKTGSPTCWSVSAAYSEAIYNANSFDYQKTGVIRVSDLAHFVAKAASNAAVKSAIAKTYALRPGEVMRDPVYGDDYPRGWSLSEKLLAAAALATVGAAALVAITDFVQDRPIFGALRT